MERRASNRLWLALLVLTAGIGLAGGFGGPFRPDADPSSTARTDPTAAVRMASTAVDAAVVPARTEARAGNGASVDPSRHGPGRGLLPLVVALLGLAGLLAVRAGMVRLPVAGRQPLRARRHAIALRAPPSLRFG